MNGNPDAPSASESRLEDLLAACLEHLDAGHEDRVEAVLAANPDCAAVLRRRIARLPLQNPQSPPPREQVGPYRVLRELGAGGMGQVYLAEQREPVRRLVAVKCIRQAFADPSALARFEAERQALALMTHPGIARVHDAGTTSDGLPYFVMEYVDGLPITNHCDDARLDLRTRLALFATLCDAVHHAHQHGIIHRDLKPSNVLVQLIDGVATPKVIDFGLAKAIHQPLTDRTLQTFAGQILGTPAYMSPEQAAGDGRAIDVRTDVYALGVMLYELVTGVRPFDDRRLAEIGVLEMLRVLREEEPPAPSSRITTIGDADLAQFARSRRTSTRVLPKSIRGEIDWIAMKALAKAPQDRYASVSELAADVRRHLAGDSVLAGPPTATYRLRKLVARHRAAFGFGTAAALFATIAIVTIVRLGLDARENLGRFDRLADRATIAALLDEAEHDLWPALPDTVPRFDAWLARARPLTTEARTRTLDIEIADLRALPAAARTDNLQVLLDGLVALRGATDRLGRDGGVIADVEARRDWALALRARSVEAHAAAWADTIDAVRTEFGLTLEPIVGLTPLGRDPVSQRLEFALHTPGGRLPTRGADGHVALRDEADDPVFVLLPGGDRIELGAQADDPSAPHFDAQWSAVDAPRETITLAPFLIAKFEITQAQWRRVMATNPSLFRPDDKLAQWRGVTSLLHPVEQVSWIDAAWFCRRLDLAIPSQGQWEYAARGGSDAPWWTGTDRESVLGHANMADHALATLYPLPVGLEPDLDDGWPVHAAVGRFAPNGFGLHDTIGNVWEWCRDAETPWPVRPDTVEVPQAWRGGSFAGDAVRCRVTSRVSSAAANRRELLGLRPVMNILRR